MPISIFQQERCFHFFIGQFVFVVKHVSIVPQENIFLQESLFPTFHRKAIFSTKACFIFTQENMFLFLHKEASFTGKPISVFILESLFLFYIGKLVSQECMFPFFYRKAHFRFSIRKLCFIFPQESLSPQESLFFIYRKVSFHVCIGKPFSLRKPASTLHRKACFWFYIGKLISVVKHVSMSPQKNMFPLLHRKVCFLRKAYFHSFMGKHVLIGNSVSTQESLFSQENLFPSKVLIHAEVQTFMFCNFRCSYCIICSYTSMFRLNSLHISFSQSHVLFLLLSFR